MATGGELKWSETAGLKQLVRFKTMLHSEALNLIDIDYKDDFEGKAA
jgi:hypothetical protein